VAREYPRTEKCPAKPVEHRAKTVGCPRYGPVTITHPPIVGHQIVQIVTPLCRNERARRERTGFDCWPDTFAAFRVRKTSGVTDNECAGTQ
jgi:hypothetical protein